MQRASGRSLRDFPNLTSAEQEVIGRARAGEEAALGTEVPDQGTEANGVRASLVRFLVLGGDDDTPVHEKGVHIEGAFIDGNLDLDGGQLVGNLALGKCNLAGTINLRGAQTRTVNLEGSRCGGIVADGVNIAGNLFLRMAFRATGPVRLLGATVAGSINCAGGRFEGRDVSGNALLCDRAKVGGNIVLADGFVALGSVRVVGATVSGSLDCDGGQFEGSDNDGDTLVCDRAQISNNAFLRNGFVSTGTVRLVGTVINGSVFCQGGRFGALVGAEERPLPEDMALNLTGATVGGTLWLTGTPLAAFHGGVNLTDAKIHRLADAVSEHTRRRAVDRFAAGAGEAPSSLQLDGLAYDRFGGDTRLSARARIAFLALQSDRNLGVEFKPQPWNQMTKVLRDMGHDKEAITVAIEKQERLRRAGKINQFAVPFHWLFGLLVGYGYRPMRVVGWMAAIWLICACFYQVAAIQGVFSPISARVLNDLRYERCWPQRGGNWTDCGFAPLDHSSFNPWAYSLDVILPPLDLQQKKEWFPMVRKPSGPVDHAINVRDDLSGQSKTVITTVGQPWAFGHLIRLLVWFENIAGWTGSLLLAATLTGLIKKD
jgi:hypothetical protein